MARKRTANRACLENERERLMSVTEVKADQGIAIRCPVLDCLGYLKRQEESSDGLSDSDETLPERWPDQIPFQRTGPGKDETIKRLHGTWIKCPFLQHAKT